MKTRAEICTGVLVGTAVGDSLGLPAENLSRHRIRRWWRGQWRQRLLFGYGVVSDDTEHAAMVALCLAQHAEDPARFQRALSWKLRLWFACLPPGIGMATVRACVRMWLGFGERSGVFSAGNGPAMRAPIIGAFFSGATEADWERRHAFVTASTQLTHTDPKANWAALAIAELAALEARDGFDVAQARGRLENISIEPVWRELVDKMFQSLGSGASVDDFAAAIGQPNAVSGYALHSVPVALYAWLRHRPNAEQALEASLNCGGDTDSVGAIVAGIAGASVGAQGFPSRWVDPIIDWPFSIKALRHIGALLGGEPVRPPMLVWPLMLVRNLVVLTIVLAHGFRRLLPPYGA